MPTSSKNSKRSIMTLFSDEDSICSHRVRLVLAEKGINVDIKYINPEMPHEDLSTLNPYNSLPTLVDRDLVLHNPHIIMEYLDERFPHPPLSPVYPVERAKHRTLMSHIGSEWSTLLQTIRDSKKTAADKARQSMSEQLISLAPVLTKTPFFFEEFSLVDCYLAPILLRLPKLGISLPEKAAPIKSYMQRIFKRSSFTSSLSDLEHELVEEYELQ